MKQLIVMDQLWHLVRYAKHLIHRYANMIYDDSSFD